MKNRKYIVCEETGSVYWLDSMNEIHQIILGKNGSFIDDGEGDCVVETWDECPETEIKVKKALGAEVQTTIKVSELAKRMGIPFTRL